MVKDPSPRNNQPMITTSSILEKNRHEIITEWMQDLHANKYFDDANLNLSVQTESEQLITSLMDITKKAPAYNPEPSLLEPIIKMLSRLNRSKVRLGYNAKDTAMYLFSLKKTFVNFLKKHYSGQPGFDLSTEIANFNNLLDIMGIFAYEEYSLDHLKEVKKRDEVISYLRYKINNDRPSVDIIGQSPAMREVFKLVGTVLDTDITVLIQGESGTGKELIAEVIHYNGPRKDQPFIAINCGALPGELIESELFGHEKGSFTGAIADKLGKFELASEGTLFLDEIGEMPLSAQVKLLRALQNMQIQRVGGTKTIHVNTRIIAATNKNLEDLVEEGKFRNDLLYRLNIFPINIPPLRNRKDDILDLASHFLKIFENKYHKYALSLSAQAKELLLDYAWPGNVRELENLIHRAVIVASSAQITPADINIQKNNYMVPENICSAVSVKDNPSIKTLSEIEKEAIEKALIITNRNIKKTASNLGISRTTLYTKIKEYDIQL